MISCHIVHPVVRQLIVELDQCTACRQYSRHHRHPNRNTRADHQTLHECPNRRTARKHNCCLCHAAGWNQQLLPMYGMGTRLRNVASREVMSRNRLSIPRTNVSMPSQLLISVETESIRRPKTGSSSHEWVAGRKTGPHVVELAKANCGFNAPNFSKFNCSLFVRLPSPTTSRNAIVVTHIDGARL